MPARPPARAPGSDTKGAIATSRRCCSSATSRSPDSSGDGQAVLLDSAAPIPRCGWQSAWRRRQHVDHGQDEGDGAVELGGDLQTRKAQALDHGRPRPASVVRRPPARGRAGHARPVCDGAGQRRPAWSRRCLTASPRLGRPAGTHEAARTQCASSARARLGRGGLRNPIARGSDFQQIRPQMRAADEAAFTTCRCWASTPTAPSWAAPRPSAAARWKRCRANGRTPCARRAAAG